MVAAEQRTEWVQPIVVDKTGTHEATVTAAALASVMAYLRSPLVDLHVWQAWLSGPFTKSVRRASPAQLDALAGEHAVTPVAVDTARAIAFTPVRYAELPRPIARLQVSGTDFPRAERVTPAGQSPVAVYVDETLTTGKAAAQAAHALFAWLLHAPIADETLFRVAPESTLVVFTPSGELAALESVAGAVPIRDNGYTEVAPGTLTAVAVRKSAVTL